MNYNINKQLIARILAGTIGLTLVGCSPKANTEKYAQDDNNHAAIETTIEEENVVEVNDIINNEEAESNNNVINKENKVESENVIYLTVTNIPENTYIKTKDKISTKLNEFSKISDNCYIIPSNDITIIIENEGNTYSYTINANNKSQVFISMGPADDYKHTQFNTEVYDLLTFDDLKNELSSINVNLGHIFNNEDNRQDIIKRTTKSYLDQKPVYTSEIISFNETTLKASTKDHDVVKKGYSALTIGDGENNIEVLKDGRLKITYDCTYINDFRVLDIMAKNVDYMLNIVNGTKDKNYYSGNDSKLIEYINEDTSINESKEKIFNGEELQNISFTYDIDGNLLLKMNLNNNFELEYIDPTGMIPTREIDFDYDDDDFYTYEEDEIDYDSNNSQYIYEYEENYHK